MYRLIITRREVLKTSGAVATLLVAAYVVTVWAMGGKPN